jgi:hypothetical protein
MLDSPQTRASLIIRLADGRDARSWGQFVEIYAPLVFQFARRRGLQEADAADITQEVLSSVSRAIGRGQYAAGKGTFRGWLLTIARNEINSVLASRPNCTWPRFPRRRKPPPGKPTTSSGCWPGPPSGSKPRFSPRPGKPFSARPSTASAAKWLPPSSA